MKNMQKFFQKQILTVNGLLFLLFLSTVVLTFGCRPKGEPEIKPEKELSEPLFVVSVLDSIAKVSGCVCISAADAREYNHLTFSFLTPQLKEFGLKARGIYPERFDMSNGLSPTGKVDMYIGKESVLDSEFAKNKLPVHKIGYLSDENGKTTFHGTFIVREDSKIQKLEDIGSDNKILLGPESSREKNELALKRLKESGIENPTTTVVNTCRETVIQIMSQPTGKADHVGVISDYSLSLFKTDEIKALLDAGLSYRILEITEETPWVAIYIVDGTPKEIEEKVIQGLKNIKDGDPEILKKMRTQGVVFLEEINAEPQTETVEEPIVEEPTVEEPAVEEPIVEEPTVEEPAVEEPIVEELTIETEEVSAVPTE